MKIALTNLGKYNEGELVYNWVTLPIEDEEMFEALKSIGVDGKKYEEYFITDYECELNIEISEYTSITVCNAIAEAIEECDEWEIQVLNILIDDGSLDIDRIIDGNLSNIISDCNVISLDGDWNQYSDLGYNYVSECYNGVQNLNSDTIESYFDYESFGRDLRINGDIYLHFEDNEEEINKFYEEYFTDYMIGEYFVDMIGMESLSNKEDYFDYEAFGRDLSYDFTISGDIAVCYR